MSLTVLSVAFPYAPVRDDVAGGAEQVLLALDHALTASGHRSVVIAAPGSRIHGTWIPSPPQTYRETIGKAIRTERPDVVHYHGLDFRDYLVPTETPTLVTLHMPAEFYRGELPIASGLFYHCVSGSQRSCFPAREDFLPTIHNGIDTDFFRPVSGRCWKRLGYAVSLGRICPEKGYHLAFESAREAGVALFLAGETFPYLVHQEYFRTEIQPRIDSCRRFIGPVGRWKKRSLLSRAQCLIVPSLVRETSSLVVMEAMACGTPVVAMRVGALPDLIEHGRTGYLVDTVAQMATAVEKAGELDRRECRRAAETRFSQAKMTARYIDTYQTLVRQPCSN